ncbi:DeoR/GlpR family DNA-binding transcription regulator [Companilactobacillus zhachilii]|uniref:DeoR/GlpR family DNA-binding transcription regulator n=1 Tax=Companilactobacillus zhachilii TaxID=2304606 RepID=UPI00403410D4
MIKEERHERILQIIDREGFIETEELAKMLSVTGMTIRRDVSELEKKNKCIRVRGGVESLQTNKKSEKTTKEKLSLNNELKNQIANKIDRIIKDGQNIFLGAGTTINATLPMLVNKNLHIVTNNLEAFNFLIDHGEDVMLTGGKLHKTTGEFYGEVAIRSFENLLFDYAIGSTNGIYGQNITTANTGEGHIQMEAFKHGKKIIIVADHTKFDESDMYTFITSEKVDFLITDNEISDSLLKKYSKFYNII